MRLIALALLVLVFGSGAFAQKTAPNWVRVTEQAGWTPRDSAGELVHRDKMWILGGWFQSFEAPPRDVWSSPDGKTWTCVVEAAPWRHSDLPMTLAFDGKMWIMGGWYNGRLPGHSASNQVWWSTDGATWHQATPEAGWSPRLASALVTFRGKMWLLGGSENYYFGDASSLKNDVWCSTDGTHWDQVVDEADWAPRAYHQAAVLGDRIYLFGGGNYVPEYCARNDVWASEDGVHWVQITEAAPWAPRLWFSTAVYRDRIWVLGGWSNNPSQNWGDVWYSRDGAAWSQLDLGVIWEARHEHSVFVFQDKLWVVGGHAQPLNSEVWSLDAPADWFEDGEE
ncbi:MAG TPA: galactose oxidase [Candidatus Hydrogenedentes bacterium]|nr:galactose oxidase [Candidatus Hydrogenedentota bacterium]